MMFKVMRDNQVVWVEKRFKGDALRVVPGYTPGRRVRVVRGPGGVAYLQDSKSGKYAKFIGSPRSRTVRWSSIRTGAHKFRDQFEASGNARRHKWIVL